MTTQPATWAQAESLYLQGTAAHKAQQHARAAELYGQSLALAPALPNLHTHLGVALCQAGQAQAGITALQKAAEYDRRQAAGSQVNLAQALAQVGRRAAAVITLRQAQALLPEDASIARRLIDLLLDDHQPEAALAETKAALLHVEANSKDWAGLLARQAMALHRLGRIEAALATHEQALPLLQDNPAAHLNYAYSLLMAGDYAAGWQRHEARLHANLRKEIGDRHFSKPVWDGRQLNGETVLVHGEQGFGDQLMFGRFVAAIAERGGKPLLVCPQPLASIMRGLPGVAEVVAPPKPPEGQPQAEFRLDHVAHDYQIPLLSLPGVLQVTLKSLSQQRRPYLEAPAKPAQQWARRLPGASLRVGLVHAGNPAHANDRNRSIAAAQLGQLLSIQGVDFVCLQTGAEAGQLKRRYPGAALTDVAADLHDFSDTAAVLANLDLLIAVDTAAVHLAGAMAVPTWLLLPQVPDWRWQMQGDETPWYARMRLFRQTVAGDWQQPLAAVAQALSEQLAQACALREATG